MKGKSLSGEFLGENRAQFLKNLCNVTQFSFRVCDLAFRPAPVTRTERDLQDKGFCIHHSCLSVCGDAILDRIFTWDLVSALTTALVK